MANRLQDDDPTLLLAHTVVIATTLSSPSTIPIQAPGDHAVTLELTAAAPAHQRVQLVEEKDFAVLDDERKQDSCQWIFDTGASNHMTGCRDTFFDLDTGVTGTVRFGDSSVVRIEGCGTILFDSKNGEHRALYNTYYIPRLTANIVSCGQLDEVDFEIMIGGGVMRVRDEQRRLLAKIRRRQGRLYVLDLAIARPVCLTAHSRRTPGAGTHALATQTSPHYARWGERDSFVAYQCCPKWSNSAKPTSLASTGVPHSQTKGCNALHTRSNCSMATSADQSPLLPRVETIISCSS